MMRIILILLSSSFIPINAYDNQYIDFKFYKNLNNCKNNEKSLIHFSKNLDVNSICLNLEKCKSTLDLSELYINYNNSNIYIKDFIYDNKCHIYNNIYYKYDIKLKNMCVIDITIIIFCILLLSCSFYLFCCSKYYLNCYNNRIRNNDSPPNYETI